MVAVYLLCCIVLYMYVPLVSKSLMHLWSSYVLCCRFPTVAWRVLFGFFGNRYHDLGKYHPKQYIRAFGSLQPNPGALLKVTSTSHKLP